ncbi:MAG TPA: zinc-ribbon domain-containing protein [Myxococcaceae bacterium]|nr:zinc-ribbon domain-containing protein [Myxococcaceae bacterium]
MIIACTQCHTRFKVPDGKVTARGLKVRCSRCGHTFRIYPDSSAERGAEPTPAAARPSGPDPFQAFGPDGTSDLEKTPARGTAVSALLARMAPHPEAEDFDVDVAGVEPASTEPAWNFPPAPSRPAPASAAALALHDEPAGETAFGVRPLAPETEPDAVADTSLPIPVRPLPPLPALPTPSSPAAPPPEEQNLGVLAGFTPAWGLAAPVRALSVDGILSSHVSSLAPAVEAEAPPPEPQFGGAGMVLDDLPSPLEPASLPAHGEVELDPGSDSRSWTGASLAGQGGMQLELEPDLPTVELDRRPAPAPVLAVASPGLAWDDPFTASPPPARPPPPSPEPALPASPAPAPATSVVLDEAPPPGPGAADHGFFEMPTGAASPPLPEPSGALLPDIPEAEEPPAAASPAASGPVPTISKPPTRTRLGLQEREQPGTARRVSAVILNVGLAALLLLVVVGLVSSWATAGRVEGSALSPRRLLQALRPGSGVTPLEVTPGTYETRSGRSLLYVRGRVLNRGAPPSRVRVRAEVWDGAQAVKIGETLAGAIATPEELWRAATPADVETLRARLLAAAAPVPDGQEADFLVLLDEAPRDLSGLRLKVTASVER